MDEKRRLNEAVKRALESEEARPAGEMSQVEWFLNALQNQGYIVVKSVGWQE